MTLNNVVFPAPLGPIRPVTRPGSAARSTSWRAMTPPKRTLTSSTDRSDNAIHLLGDLGSAGVLAVAVAATRRLAAEAVGGARELADDPIGAAGDGHRPESGSEERDVLDVDQ